MAQIITPILSTAVGLGMTYGAGAANVAAGSLGKLAQGRLDRIAKEKAHYKTLNDAQKTLNAQHIKPTQSADSDNMLVDESLNESSTSSAQETISGQETINKIQTITEDRFNSTQFSKQLKQVEGMYRVDKANQASFYAQSVMGGAQVAVATSALGNATFSVAMTAIGFSFISSIFYLCASIYGCFTAQSQLSENRQKQQDLLQAIANINNPGQAADMANIEANLEPDNSFLIHEDIHQTSAQITMLNNALKVLETEEALLVQQRNAQAINIVAALMSLGAIALFTAGTHGIGPIIYYVLLAGSVLLPLIAMGYSHCSMNETKYMRVLQDQYSRTVRIGEQLQSDKKATPESIIELILPMIQLIIDDPQTRLDIYKLLETLLTLNPAHLTSREEQIEKLQELLKSLMELHSAFMKEDLECRLRIAGINPNALH